MRGDEERPQIFAGNPSSLRHKPEVEASSSECFYVSPTRTCRPEQGGSEPRFNPFSSPGLPWADLVSFRLGSQ